MYTVAVIVGSLRADSINRKVAEALAKLAAPALQFNIVDLTLVPIYNEDLWDNPPAAVLNLKAAVEAADAVLFVMPEYNRSIPAVLKNTIEWGTRPRGRNSWAEKPAAVVGASPGNVGSAVGQSHLRSIAPVLQMSLMSHPEVYLTYKPEMIDSNKDFTDPTTRTFLKDFLTKYENWIARVKK